MASPSRHSTAARAFNAQYQAIKQYADKQYATLKTLKTQGAGLLQTNNPAPCVTPLGFKPKTFRTGI